MLSRSRTKQSFSLSLSLEKTVTLFFSNTGETAFIDQMAASVNIVQLRFRIAGENEGAVVIESKIAEDDPTSNDDNKISEIKSLSSPQSKTN